MSADDEKEAVGVREIGWALYRERNNHERRCVYCGEPNVKKRWRSYSKNETEAQRSAKSRHRTIEHLCGLGATKSCFANPHLFVVPVHYGCNQARSRYTTRTLNAMLRWSMMSLHPSIRTRLPKRPHDDDMWAGTPPGPKIKKGQGAWK